MIKQTTITLAALAEREYLAKGVTRHEFACLLKVQCGVSLQSSQAALAGTRVKAETAQALASWALRTHKERLNIEAMVVAPVRPKRGTRAARAERLVGAR